MEARSRSPWIQFSALTLAALLALASQTSNCDAADFRTQNFLVSARDARMAKQVAQAAEKFRAELAQYWLGQELAPWPYPCPVVVHAGMNIPAQGVTTYKRSPVRDFQMQVYGSPQRILDSVLPHEVTHTVLATYFGRPLPRWADEGICTTVEHVEEKAKHEAKLREFLANRRGIPMNQMFLLTEYPDDILPLYAQGYSVCQFLIAQKGPRPFIQFLEDFMQRPSWTANVQKHYGYTSLRELQDYWLKWVDSGGGDVQQFVAASRRGNVQLASATLPGSNSKNAASNSTGPAVLNAPQTRMTPALAAATQAGWYSHQRQLQAAREHQAASSGNEMASVNSLIAPPSVLRSGRYSSAHPQPEQGTSPPVGGLRISGEPQNSWR